MAKCSQCRADEATDTWWEKMRLWLAWHIFPTDMKDEGTSQSTLGFAQGYTIGREHEREQNNLAYTLNAKKDIPVV